VSARVNLLPPEIRERPRQLQVRNLTIAGVAGWAALLALLYILKLGTIGAAESERDGAQADLEASQAQLAALQPYAELDAEVAARNATVAAALGDEISWARLLNDLSLSFPPSASLLTLTAATDAAEGTADAEGGVTDNEVGEVVFTGYSVDGLAPGVEAVLLRLGEVPGLVNTYLSQAADEARGDVDVTTFDGTAALSQDVYSGRYAEGLPPELDE
jgi:type IV pilus assembly protein PilN